MTPDQAHDIIVALQGIEWGVGVIAIVMIVKLFW